MKEVTIIGYCDGDHEERVRSVVEREVAVDGSKPVALDLCANCDVLISNLLSLMERGVVVREQGSKKKSAVKKSPPKQEKQEAVSPNSEPPKDWTPGVVPPLEGPHICPECGFESKSRSALGQHLLARHQKGFRDFTDAAPSDAA